MQIIHGVVDAPNVPDFNADIPRLLRTAAEHNRVIIPAEALRNRGVGGIHAGNKADALVRHQVNAALKNRLRQLHIGDAVSQNPADTGMLFNDSDTVAAVVELIRHRKSGGA